MWILPPLTIGEAEITASNLTENDEPVWSAGTYSLGTVRMHNHAIWESLIDANTAEPGTDATKWMRLRATNKFRPFDQINSSQAENADEITYTIQPGQMINMIGFVALDAIEVEVSITVPGQGVVYSETKSALDLGGRNNFYDWFFKPFEYRRELVFAEIPTYADAPNATIEIAVRKPDGTARVGEILLGSVWKLAETTYGTEIRLRDFSTNERNAFGDAVLVKRDAYKVVTYQAVMDPELVGYASDRLRGLVSTKLLFMAGEDLDRYGTTTFGTIKNAPMPLDGPTITGIEFEVEGLI